MENKTDYSRETFNALSEYEKHAKSKLYVASFHQTLTLALKEIDLNAKKIEKELLDYALALSYVSFINADLFNTLNLVVKQLLLISEKVPSSIYYQWMLALAKQDPRVINGFIPIIPLATRRSPEFQKIVMHEYRMQQAKWIGCISFGIGFASFGILILEQVISLSPYLSVASLVVGIGVFALFSCGYHKDPLINIMAQDPFSDSKPKR